ncbi:MAG: TolC family protein, partial [Solirubrobacteraceae bacterium]
MVTSRGTASLTVTTPLWYDLAGKVTAAPERAARVEIAASEFDLRHARAASAHAAALAYWSYLAATRQLDALRTAEARAARLVEETRALVRADVRTEADVTRLVANLASKRASRIGAEQAVDESWSALREVTGMPRAADGTAALPPPVTDFPEPALHDDLAQAAAEADTRRSDLAAARQRRDEMRLLRDAAAASERPRLDLVVGIGYTGAEQGGSAVHMITPLGRASSGLNSSLQLRHVLPVFNQSARGLLMQSTAAYEQQDLLVADLARRIEARVTAAIAGVQHAKETLVASRESVELAEKALENEKQKSALGASTLPDVLLAEDALTGAQLSDLSARHA